MRLSASRSDGLCCFAKRGSSSSGSDVISDTSAEEIIVSPDERRVHLRINGDLLVTSTSKSGSSSTGDSTSEDVKIGSLAGA